MIAAFDPLRGMRVLFGHGVKFIVIGRIAARAWDSRAAVLNVLEICFDETPENREALTHALESLMAHPRGTTVGRYETSVGALDCVPWAGACGYSDLVVSAREVEIEHGMRVLFASEAQ